MPYAVAAAFFVPGRWVRLGALAVLGAAVAHGGFVGPAQARQRQHQAEVARYREHPELLYVDTHGEMLTVHAFPDGTRAVTLIRRHGNVEAEVTSQTLDETGLRRVLNTLHPLSDTELEELMREKKIDHRI
ncbi:hypothetical protein [Streptomyces noursei]|uniref:hypothetical protein n=1 Tax=Streptomyces noursei TaxID=1971 RepID=UPI00198E92BB|nr:hypothetical protein [Streptomyces noursei]MCZ1013398.1 hypothetical protein [Streptomyces noursei]GGX47981.1 hypothetical protein GCM10010341_82050 [Streptomyces noursei]